MNLNFELILFYVTLLAGVIALVDLVFFAKRRKCRHEMVTKQATSPREMKLPIIVDYAYAFFPVLLLVFSLRAFVYEPFKIPSSSLEPTLLIGDFILVNKFDYGIRLPIIHKKIYKIGEPARGDLIIFRWPPNPSVDFIKRVIGLPGDKISYIDKVLYINGEKIPQELQGFATPQDEENNSAKVSEKQENLLGVKHDIYQNPDKVSHDFRDIVVPEGMYFVMGDNRDNSADSRFWGFVPDKNIIGKATHIWMSWNSPDHKIRWSRLAKKIN